MSRAEMTYRVVRLDSSEASTAPEPRSQDEGSRMMAELSLAAWQASGRPLPSYTRATMPIRLTTLEALAQSDEA